MKLIISKGKDISLIIFPFLFFILGSYTSIAQVGIGTMTPNSTFEVSGSMGQKITTVTASTTLDATHSIVICNNGSTAITITLPTAVGITGRVYTIKREDTSTATVTIATTSSQTIDWAATTLLLTNRKEAVTIFSDGSNWKKMASNDSNNVQYPIGQISYFNSNGTLISITNTSDGSDNFVVCDPATSFSGNSEFDSPSAGRLRYIGTKTKFFHIACTISVFPSGTSSNNFVFAVSKNGTLIPESRVMQKLPTGDTQSTAMHVAVYLSTNDYLELTAGNLSSTGDVYVRSLNLFALGMFMN